MSELIEGLYQVGAMGGELNRAIRELAPDAIFNMAFELNDEEKRDRPRAEFYRHYGFGDGSIHTQVNMAELAQAVEEVTGLLRQDKVVIIHCAVGANRSGLLSALAIREFLNITGAEAVAIVKANRKIAGWVGGALSNPSYASFVRTLGKPAVDVSVRVELEEHEKNFEILSRHSLTPA